MMEYPQKERGEIYYPVVEAQIDSISQKRSGMVIGWSKNKKEELIDMFDDRVREEAIRRTKSKIALQGKSSKDYSEDQLEILVADEEVAYKRELKDKSLFALLAIFGLQIF